MDKRMDEILHTVALEANSELELDSLCASISTEYKKQVKFKSTARRWISAAAALVVLVGAGVFAQRSSMIKLKSAPDSEKRMDALTAELAPQEPYGFAGENESFEAPEAPAEEPAAEDKSLNGSFRLPEACIVPDSGEVSSEQVLDAGVREFIRGSSGFDLTPEKLPEGWTLTTSENGWSAVNENGAALDCLRLDSASNDRAAVTGAGALSLGQAVSVSFKDGSVSIYYKASEDIELCFYGTGIEENELLEIALSVGELID